MTEPSYRALFLTNSIGGGGAERHLLALIEGMAEMPVERHLAIGRPGGEYESELPGDLAITYLRSRGMGSALLSAASWRRPLQRLLRCYRPDVVFSISGQTNVLSVLCRQSPRTAHVLGIQNALSVKYSPGPITRSVTSRLVRANYPHADALVACSKATARDAESFVGLEEGRVVTIPNATRGDVAEQAAKPLDLERPEGPLVVACGRLVEQKGFDVLVEATHRLREHLPASLWIIGEGPDRADLERQIAAAGLEGRVSLLGYRDNPWNAMAAADVFALSSNWEGYGLVLDEAMACRIPIVSTDCPHGTSETIEEGKCGLLVPTGDAWALAAGLRKVLEDRDLAAEYVAAGLDKQRRTSSAAIAARYHELFERQIRERRK